MGLFTKKNQEQILKMHILLALQQKSVEDLTPRAELGKVKLKI
jgi:hypothetical protein